MNVPRILHSTRLEGAHRRGVPEQKLVVVHVRPLEGGAAAGNETALTTPPPLPSSHPSSFFSSSSSSDGGFPYPHGSAAAPSAASALTEEAHEALLPHMRVKDVRSPGPEDGCYMEAAPLAARPAVRHQRPGLPPQQHAPQELVRRERQCARQKEFPPPPPVACDRHKLAPPPQQQVQGAPLALRPPGERWGTEERRDI